MEKLPNLGLSKVKNLTSKNKNKFFFNLIFIQTYNIDSQTPDSAGNFRKIQLI